jgi:hypothetical protein
MERSRVEWEEVNNLKEGMIIDINKKIKGVTKLLMTYGGPKTEGAMDSTIDYINKIYKRGRNGDGA